MLFSSLSFLVIFLPLLLFLYFLIPKISYKNMILLIFSLFFYSWGEPLYIFLMIFVILISYLFALLINVKKHKKFLILSVGALLLILIVFKYSNFLIMNINLIFKINIKNINLPLPIGISFYTFQALSYLIDVYRKKVKVQKNPLKLALYICLFPQLIAGPIVRYETIEKEIELRKHSLEKFEKGFKRFILGLSKKIMFANNFGLIADTLLTSDYPSTLLYWVGVLSYSLQIYYDFSGYSDMAIGLGKIFGFNFLENFNYPYISQSITEFWKRWHISLSSWFKDYVYIPLGGSKKGLYRNILNLLIVWTLTGFWHGASWNFIFWGMYFAVLLILEKFVLKNIITKIPKFLRRTMTMFLIAIGWCCFKITDLSLLFSILKNLFIFNYIDFNSFIFRNTNLITKFYFLIPGIILCFPLERIKNRILRLKKYFIFQILDNVIYIILFIINIILLLGDNYNPFIYFRF